MAQEDKTLLDPLKQLLFVVADERFVPRELASTINTSNALLEDLGAKMAPHMRARWKEKVVGAAAGCEANRYSQDVEMQKLCTAALRALEGRFCEIVEKDYLMASGRYEQAANTIGFISDAEIDKVGKIVFKSVAQGREERLSADSDETAQAARWFLWFHFVPPVVGLWDWAGDAYCQMEGRMGDAQRCYEHGLEVLRSKEEEAEDSDNEQWRAELCHLSLSLASILLAHSDEWEKVERLYRNAADVVFFGRQARSNEEYSSICDIVVGRDSWIAETLRESDVTPHVRLPVAEIHKDTLVRLKAEIGEKALDTLRKDFEKSEEGFPIPETYYLIAALGELYMQLGQYERCADILGEGTFLSESFYEWTYDQLLAEHDWAFHYLVHTHNKSFARGLLKRPDYKEFLEQMRKTEESHQRQEWRQIRIEGMIDRARGSETLEVTQNKLMKENPWLEGAVNPGSVVNAEVIYQQLSSQNWGEVVVGLCNAVEEELKQFLYKEYLAFVAERAGGENYAEESERQKKKGSVLHFIAGLRKNNLRYQIWAQFASTKMKEHSGFLANKLPELLAELVDLRGTSAHGKMSERKSAEKARDIVLGTKEKLGLLGRLIALRSPSGIGGVSTVPPET